MVLRLGNKYTRASVVVSALPNTYRFERWQVVGDAGLFEAFFRTQAEPAPPPAVEDVRRIARYQPLSPFRLRGKADEVQDEQEVTARARSKVK